MKRFDVTALGELLIDFTENGKSSQGNIMMEANPGGAPCNVLAILTKLDKKTELCLRLYCYSTAQLICEWILGKHKLKLDELVDIFDISMPVPLKKYLF